MALKLLKQLPNGTSCEYHRIQGILRDGDNWIVNVESFMNISNVTTNILLAAVVIPRSLINMESAVFSQIYNELKRAKTEGESLSGFEGSEDI